MSLWLAFAYSGRASEPIHSSGSISREMLLLGLCCMGEFDWPDTPTGGEPGGNEPVSTRAPWFASLDLAIASSPAPKTRFSLIFLQSRRLEAAPTTSRPTSTPSRRSH